MAVTWKKLAYETDAILASVLTTRGDLIRRGASAPERVALGSSGQVIGSNGTDAVWTTPASNRRNFILNGNFSVNQRGTGPWTAEQYTSDRWYCFRGASAAGKTFSSGVSHSVASLSGTALRLQRDSGNTSTQALYAVQPIISADSVPLGGQTVTLSFYAKAGANYSPTSSYLVSYISTGTGSDEGPAATWTGQAHNNQNNAITTSWARYTHTVTLAASITQVKVFFEFNPIGTAGAADLVDIAGVQLEIGGSATDFEEVPWHANFELCKVYYRLVGAGATGVCDGTTSFFFGTPFFPPMRATPTLALVDTSIGLRIPGNDTTSSSSSIVAADITAVGAAVLINGWSSPALTAGHGGTERYGTNFLSVSAEL